MNQLKPPATIIPPITDMIRNHMAVAEQLQTSYDAMARENVELRARVAELSARNETLESELNLMHTKSDYNSNFATALCTRMTTIQSIIDSAIAEAQDFVRKSRPFTPDEQSRLHELARALDQPQPGAKEKPL